MGRPEKIIVEKRPNNNYRIICVDEMTNMCNALDIGENAYKALKHHFTGVMEISLDEVNNCAIHGVREHVLDWWGRQPAVVGQYLCAKYYKKRHLTTLTGREIQNIWEQEHE